MFGNKLINSAVFLLLISFYTGCTDNNAGGTIETTNGVVAGIISDTISAGNEETIIHLIPSDFNPVQNNFNLIYSDTLSNNSTFEFKNLPPNKYNIEIKTSMSNLRAFYGTVNVDNSTENVDTIHLNYSGSLLLTDLPDSLENIESLFIMGTTFCWNKSSVTSNDSIFIADLPANSELPPLKYLHNNKSNDITMNLEIQPNDTFTLAAFTFLLQVNNSFILPSNRISKLVTDACGTVWIGSYDKGFYIRTADSWETFKMGNSTSKLPSDSITSISTGITIFGDTVSWIGTTEGLLKRWSTKEETVYTQTDIPDLPSNNIQSLEFDNSNGLWIGTDSGLIHFNGTTSQVYTSPFSSKKITFCTLDPNNVIWIANSDGLARYSSTNNWEIILSKAVTAMSSLNKRKELWIAQEDSSISISSGGNSISQTLETEYKIQTIFESSDSLIYLGTSEGVIIYRNNSFSALNPNAFVKLNGFSITSITEDINKNLWFGTKNNGIIIMGPTALQMQ